jgi:hypothetical protein
MSNIWAKCERYGAVPFFGFPVIPKVEDGMFIYEFPEGYTPGSSETQDVADHLLEILGSSIVEVTNKIVKVVIDNTKLALLIHEKQREYYVCGSTRTIISKQEEYELTARIIAKEVKSQLKEKP